MPVGFDRGGDGGQGTISYPVRDTFLSEYAFHFVFTVFSSIASPTFCFSTDDQPAAWCEPGRLTLAPCVCAGRVRPTLAPSALALQLASSPCSDPSFGKCGGTKWGYPVYFFYFSREQLAVRNVLDFRPGLLAAQCRQLGTWLREGGPLAGVYSIQHTEYSLRLGNRIRQEIPCDALRFGLGISLDLSHFPSLFII